MKKGKMKLMMLLAVGLFAFASCGGSSDTKSSLEKAIEKHENSDASAVADEEWLCQSDCENGKTYSFGGRCPECYEELALKE